MSAASNAWKWVVDHRGFEQTSRTPGKRAERPEGVKRATRNVSACSNPRGPTADDFCEHREACASDCVVGSAVNRGFEDDNEPAPEFEFSRAIPYYEIEYRVTMLGTRGWTNCPSRPFSTRTASGGSAPKELDQKLADRTGRKTRE